MNRRIKYVVLIIVVVFLIVFTFNEMFFNRIISSKLIFQQLAHYENRTDILSYINIIVSSIISLLVYKLSKSISEQNNLEKERKKYESICVVYDYLNEVIIDIKKQVFRDKEDYHKLEYKENFMQNVYNLNKDVLYESDIESIRKIDLALKNYLNNSNTITNSELSIKWVYKSIFDLNIKIDDIKKMSNLVEIDMMLNLQILSILSKLRKELKYNYFKNAKYENYELKIFNKKNKISIEKYYDEEHYMMNDSGYIEIYEPVFYLQIENNSVITFKDGGLVYNGSINYFKLNGMGTYYYYKKLDETKVCVNSDNLVDVNADKIKKILENKNIMCSTNLKFVGSFEDGVIKDGDIIFDDENLQDLKIKK